jgi:hypothetical protein
MLELQPSCWRCAAPIRRFDGLWREDPDGNVRAAWAVDLTALVLHGGRVWHVGCWDPTGHPAPHDRSPSGLPREHLLAGAVI